MILNYASFFSYTCSGRRITSRGLKDLDQIAGQVRTLVHLLMVQVCSVAFYATAVEQAPICGNPRRRALAIRMRGTIIRIMHMRNAN